MFEQAFKRIDDVLRKEAGCTTELDYTEQTSWLLFLKYLDGLEEDKATEAALEGKKYTFILDKPYRWESWAAPRCDGRAQFSFASSKSTTCFRALSMSSGTSLKSCSNLGLSRTGADRILSLARLSETSISTKRLSILRKWA
jgi:hypothetical protein